MCKLNVNRMTVRGATLLLFLTDVSAACFSVQRSRLEVNKDRSNVHFNLCLRLSERISSVVKMLEVLHLIPAGTHLSHWWHQEEHAVEIAVYYKSPNLDVVTSKPL